jgi:RimJ/RimL family protein N-acetyltransferase
VIELQPWSEEDLPLVERFLGDPEMTRHLGGQQSHEQIVEAHRRFLATAEAGEGTMFKIVVGPGPEVAGAVGYWERTWQEQVIYETGWDVFPAYQGRGLASRAAALVVAAARSARRHRFLHAFPPVTNAPSNAVCRRLGFMHLGECDFEYPRGNWLRCNDWRLDLLEE